MRHICYLLFLLGFLSSPALPDVFKDIKSQPGFVSRADVFKENEGKRFICYEYDVISQTCDSRGGYSKDRNLALTRLLVSRNPRVIADFWVPVWDQDGLECYDAGKTRVAVALPIKLLSNPKARLVAKEAENLLLEEFKKAGVQCSAAFRAGTSYISRIYDNEGKRVVEIPDYFFIYVSKRPRLRAFNHKSQLPHRRLKDQKISF
ncbi:MAG: hypothetical protein AAFW47_00820 [Pseudomonadota bacterium]